MWIETEKLIQSHIWVKQLPLPGMTFDKMIFIVVKFHLYIEPNRQVCLNWFWHNYFYYIVWHLSDIAENLLINYSSKDILSISAQFSKSLFHNFKYKTQQYIKPYFSHCSDLISHYKQHLWFLKNYKMHCCCHCQWHFVLVFIANMFIVVTTNSIVLIVIKQCLHSSFSLFSWFFAATLVIIVSVMVNCIVTMLSWFAKWKMINIVHAPFGPKLFSPHFAVYSPICQRLSKMFKIITFWVPPVETFTQYRDRSCQKLLGSFVNVSGIYYATPVGAGNELRISV